MQRIIWFFEIVMTIVRNLCFFFFFLLRLNQKNIGLWSYCIRPRGKSLLIQWIGQLLILRLSILSYRAVFKSATKSSERDIYISAAAQILEIQRFANASMTNKILPSWWDGSVLFELVDILVVVLGRRVAGRKAGHSLVDYVQVFFVEEGYRLGYNWAVV